MTEKTNHDKAKSTTTNTSIPANAEEKKEKKICPALYPSKPHTSDK